MKKGDKFFRTLEGKVYIDRNPRSIDDVPGKGPSPLRGRPSPLLGRSSPNKGKRKSPIYELPNGIKVLHENNKAVYVMCRIEAHPLFPNSKISAQRTQYIQRSRLVITSLLGRVLSSSEHIHHKNESEKQNDDLDNLEILWLDEHNKHHKLGFKHTKKTKLQISESMRIAHAESRHSFSARMRALRTSKCFL